MCKINANAAECLHCEKPFDIQTTSRSRLYIRADDSTHYIHHFSQTIGDKTMPNSPKNNEEKMLMVLNAWKTLAPDKQFGGMTVAQYETQINKSLAPRTRLDELDGEIKQQQALRETEDETTMSKVNLIVNGVLADPTEGDDSALYEAMGYIRKSDRKSGLTRKRVEPAKQ